MCAVVDAGSAGASTFPGLRKFIMNTSKTRVLALVNIALQGLAWAGMAGIGKGGELDSLHQVRHLHWCLSWRPRLCLHGCNTR